MHRKWWKKIREKNIPETVGDGNGRNVKVWGVNESWFKNDEDFFI